MLRVLHCLYDDLGNPWVAGGAAVRAFEVYRRLADRTQVRIVTGNYPGARDQVIDGVRYERRGVPSPYAVSRFSFARSARKLLQSGGYDVAVYDFSVYAPIRVPPPPAPVGIIVHHLTGPTARLRWGPALGRAVAEVENRLLRRGHWFCVPSRATLEHLRAIVPPNAVIHVVGSGVAPQLFEVERRDEGFLLYFGRLDLFQKGLDTLLQAVASLAETRRDVELRIAGRGRDGARVRELTHRLQIEDRVHILGPVDNAGRDDLFSRAALLMMPSRFEGWGMVAAEAMAAGLPVVSSRAGSLPEIIAEPDGGVLVPPGNPRALAQAVAELLDAPERRHEIGASARESARRRFSWEAVADAHFAFLQQIAEASTSASS